MKRKTLKTDKILKEVSERLGDFYSDKQVEQVGGTVLKVLIDAYTRGDIVDFGIGKSYLKLRKNNSNFSPARSHSIVFRGDVKSEISGPMIESALRDNDLFEMLYSRRGSDD